MTKINSSYWLSDWDDDDIIVDNLNEVQRKSLDLYKLASAKRAISNFVNIVTNDSIPVNFSQRGDSYTDGKTVVIGSDVTEPKDFDVTVGLALHEGSHIKLSDFDLLRRLSSIVPDYITEGAIKKGIMNSLEIIKNLWNYVEDRRIDEYVFSSSPGYRDYYRAMYDKYFNDKLIDKAILSDEYTEECVDSYMFRIINLHNKNTDLSKLKGLREIYKVVGLGSINRLKNSQDTFEVALNLFQIIMTNLTLAEDVGGEGEGESNESNESQNGQGEGSGSSNGTREMTDEEFEDLSNGMNGYSPMGGDDSESPNGGSGMDVENVPNDMGNTSSSNSKNGKETEKVKLSDRQKQLLKKKIQKQKDFMNGKVKKKSVSKKDAKNLEAIQESGSEVSLVGDGVPSDGWGSYPQKGIECIVVKNLTQSLFVSDMFPMTWQSYSFKSESPVRMDMQKEVDRGIRIGTILGKKLQVRGEDRNTIFNRQKVGKIDKRMISSLGFGNENVFQYNEIDSYKKANLHISVDASGSMGGDKWSKTLTNVVALCKAVDMIQNLNIQVSFRGCSQGKPYVVLAYDSRTDKFSKVKQMFPAFNVFGTTPEGLTFEAIMKHFLPSNNDMDSYFLNLSDGEPYFTNNSFYYGGKPAEEHTKKMVRKIEGMGIKTLSYFISEYGQTGYGANSFKRMYGNGAEFIKVDDISQITRTMNKLFLSKN